MTDPDFSAIKAILFDKDGTLLRYDESWGPVNREAAHIAANGDAALEARLLDVGGMDDASGHTRADSLFAAGSAADIARGLIAVGSPLDAEDLTQKLDALFLRAADYSVPAADLAGFFGKLKARGLKLGVASSDNEAAIRATADRFDFARYLDFVTGYDSGHGVKPEPGMLLAFASAVGVDPSEVAMVGDNSHDMHVGLSAGAGLRIAVLTGTGTTETLSPLADIVLADITLIEDLLP
ncbi:HAD-IA family hydrolase [Rhizobiales bacterium RZME27]|uniref:phosphoglycolate phosphatase n=1 Tax=Endobacterium cereale TaxID=2663029 RepID=A0A6A8AEQ3_9HYPH|nr:HAD family hydrolase [Endobacterium cereale]MEB2846885.1 HAD family hydrolase [Endobacterium cereale]MQY47696.1 HAD-IA family hydrolase [Endobacterium cereale]